MPKLFLFGPVSGNSIALNVDTPVASGTTARSLELPNGEAFALNPPLAIDHRFFDSIPGGTDLKFKVPGDGTSLDVPIPFAVSGGGDFKWFGVQFNSAASITATLTIHIPAALPETQPKPFVTIEVCGAFDARAVGAAGVAGVSAAVYTAASFCCQVEITDLPALPSAAPLPLFSLRLPDLGIRFPKLSLPWTFPNFPKPPFHLGGFSPQWPGLPVNVSYDSLDADVDPTAGNVSIDIHHLRIGGKMGTIEADLHLVLDASGINPGTTIHIYRPDFAHTIDLPISKWKLSKGCLMLGWNADRFQDLLALVLPDFVAGNVSADVVLRILAGDGGVTEIRLDWTAAQTPSLSLPGFDLTAAGTFSLVADLKDSRLLLALTIDSGTLSASSSFLPFGRSDGTELQRTQATEPFLKLDLTVKAAATVLLADLPTGSGNGPRFFKQFKTALTLLNFTNPDCTPVPYGDSYLQSLQSANFNAALTVNANNLKLPMLATPDQFLSITLGDPPILVLGNDPVVKIGLTVIVQVSTFKAQSTIALNFHLESFAFTIDDSAGISFTLDQPLQNVPFFGLNLTALGPKGVTTGFELLRLVTKDSNYQLVQGKDCVFQLSYTDATAQGQPILFNVTNFSIGPKGVDLDAAVLPRPARLSGIDTEFTFTQGTFQMRESQIQDFSIAGSGPMPPDLVGSATASIALQFHKPQQGSLTLVSGSAHLDGKNLLKCQGTRFQFSVDALGLKFVNDGGFHLYFTVTGTARFTPFAGDDPSGPLALLNGIELRLMECPLTGDARIISKHVEFLVELPRKVSFSFLSCFEMEVRAIGFLPQAPMFDDATSAMQLTGQIKFGDTGDTLNASIDFHGLYIALPEPGSLVPRLHCKELGVGLCVADAFELTGMVDFLDDEEIQPGLKASGFRGQGSVTIQGLPTLAVSFAFLRVRAPGAATYDRAWFVYVQVPKISIEIPALEIFIREIGFGFGYRYTLAMIGAADQIQDPKELIKKLQALSLSQGELASFNQWSVDDVTPGGAPRWTIVFRAMIAETSATQSPTEWLEKEEEEIPCLFLMDAVVALRSDLTFLMSARGWLFTNYWDYLHNTNGVATAPLVSGFVLLSPRQGRFLAHVATNPNGKSGSHPPLPDLLQSSITSCYFTATLLIQHNLFHAEIGWPNQLRWAKKVDPIDLEFTGGAIFRVASTEMVAGFSFQARGSFAIRAGIDLGFIGARLTATAQVAYGARYIGVLAFTDVANRSAYYAVQGIDIRVHVEVAFWIHIDLLFGSINIDFNFNFDLAFTLAFQFGLLLKSPWLGFRGTATVALNIMGHGLNFGITLALNQEAVDIARSITEPYLNVGLEASDAEAIPGEPPLGDPATAAQVAPAAPPLLGLMEVAHAVAAPATNTPPLRPKASTAEVLNSGIAQEAAPVPVAAFVTPNYSIFSVPPPPGDPNALYYFVLIPSATRNDSNNRLGFLPPPPAKDSDPLPVNDFEWTLPAAVPGLKRYNPATGVFDKAETATLTWQVAWSKQVGTRPIATGNPPPTQPITLAQTLRYAYTLAPLPAPLPPPDQKPPDFGAVTPIDDPIWLPPSTTNPQAKDGRLNQTTDSAYEAAVRGATQQVSSPRFRPDSSSSFDVRLSKATSFHSTVYQTQNGDQTKDSVPRAVQLRSGAIHQIIRDLSTYVRIQRGLGSADDLKYDFTQLTAFLCGLVFNIPANQAPAWLQDVSKDAGTIRQRTSCASTAPDTGAGKQGLVKVFNTLNDCFNGPRPPRFDNVRQFADENTIAISWDLVWPETDGTNAQEDPEHHLAYYLVRRKPLSGNERSLQYTVRPVDVLHKADDNGLTGIRTRFHVFDDFNHESAQIQAQLPRDGRSYLYTITPVDIAGNASSRPLSLVATRYPQQPPLVPANAELWVSYSLEPGKLAPLAAPKLQEVADPLGSPADPPLLRVYFPQPVVPAGTPIIPAQQWQLLFRREQAMPIGTYGLGSSAQGSQSQGLPVSNAAPLRGDIKIALTKAENLLNTDGSPDTRLCFTAPVASLQTAGILSSDGSWRPDSWLVFIQAGSQPSEPNVWSSLAQVQPVLAFYRDGSKDPVLRRPATLEFLSQPVIFGPLPPEDTGARVGYALVPMPAGQGQLDLTSNPVAGIFYGSHPERPRAVQFQWNQAPSDSGIPPDLNAGFNLYELDLDAHPQEDLANADLIEANLRLIQQVELLPPDQVAMTPPDTLQVQKWEAWYPATVARADLAKQTGLNLTYSNWFSWRDSEVIWPPTRNTTWPTTPQDPQVQQDMFAAGKLPRMHPFLQQVVAALSPAPDQALPLPRPLPPRVYVAPIPAGTATDIAGFMQENAASTDPYGWRMLQRFGLSICLQIRNPLTGDPYPASKPGKDGDDGAVALVKKAIGKCLAEGMYPDLAKHVHLELLFQPGKSVQLDNAQNPPPDGSWLLDSVQVSLRPVANYLYKYCQVDIVWSPPTAKPPAPPEPPKPAPSEIVLNLGTITDEIDIIAQTLQRASNQPPVEVGQWVVLKPDTPGPSSLKIGFPQSGKLTLLLRSRSFLNPVLTTDAGFKPSDPKPFDFSDQRASYFTQRDWLTTPDEQWSLLRLYLTMPKITLPEDKQLLTMPGLLPWLQRFLDYAPGTAGQSGSMPTGGPWLATAYPRLLSPLATAPDSSGRVTSFQLITDEYAHAFRYYVRSWGRYDALWQSIASSPLYAADRKADPKWALQLSSKPDPAAGGLDVVLDRVHQVAQPLILSSRRIDPPVPAKDAQSAASVWELIVARHPEQSLAERNWTVARQLAWGQLVYTLMRTFAYQNRLPDLQKALPAGTLPKLLPPSSALDGSSSYLPGPYPDPEEERLDFSNEADIRAVDLPLRNGVFGQGALIVQYRGLPYFYKHRFTVAAQAGRVVSDASSSIQQDFEYRSPVPNVTLDATDAGPRSRLFNIRLASYWECSPPAAQAQWPIEDPTGKTAFSTYSSLPDLSVIYQLVFQRSGGVADPIAEFSFPAGGTSYTVKQLNANPDLAILDKPKIQVMANAAVLAADMATSEETRIADYKNWLATGDLKAIASCPGSGALPSVIGPFVERWFPSRAVSVVPAVTPAIEVRQGDSWILAYDGQAKENLEAWAASVDDGLAKIIRDLKPVTAAVQIAVRPLLSMGDIPSPLSHSFNVDPSSVTWKGASSDALLTQFDHLLTTLPDRSPAKTALAALRLELNTTVSFPLVPAVFTGTKPDRQALATLLANPLTNVTVNGADNAWSIASTGINLGEPAENLLLRLEAAITDSADPRRQALATVFTSVVAFTKTAAIPGVPANLAAHLMLAPYLLHVKGPIDPAQLFLNAGPNKDSMTRLQADIAAIASFKKDLTPWISEEAISSRNIFPSPDIWQDRQEFPIPEACELRLDGPITSLEKSQLLAINADAEFNNAIRQLASGAQIVDSNSGNAQPQPANIVRVSVGLEQILEILPVAGVPTAANRKLTWRTPLRPAQASALDRWVAISSFRATFAVLRTALAAYNYHKSFDPLEEYPRDSELPPVLRSRLNIEPGVFDWNGFSLEPEEESALQDMANDATLGPTFHSVVAGLLEELRHTGTVTVDVQESGWAPRPRQGDWLPEKLLIGNASIRVFGLMTQDQARALANGQGKPDHSAIERLFATASTLGLNGAGMEVWARLGPAPTAKQAVGLSITLKG